VGVCVIYIVRNLKGALKQSSKKFFFFLSVMLYISKSARSASKYTVKAHSASGHTYLKGCYTLLTELHVFDKTQNLIFGAGERKLTVSHCSKGMEQTTMT
jgi:hypothetical protein